MSDNPVSSIRNRRFPQEQAPPILEALTVQGLAILVLNLAVFTGVVCM